MRHGEHHRRDRGGKGAPGDAAAFAVLGLPVGASQHAISRAYRVLARDTHPDTNPNDPEAVRRFRDVTAAYHQLADRVPTPDGEEPGPSQPPPQPVRITRPLLLVTRAGPSPVLLRPGPVRIDPPRPGGSR